MRLLCQDIGLTKRVGWVQVHYYDTASVSYLYWIVSTVLLFRHINLQK